MLLDFSFHISLPSSETLGPAQLLPDWTWLDDCLSSLALQDDACLMKQTAAWNVSVNGSGNGIYHENRTSY